jgi:hypothetical protein
MSGEAGNRSAANPEKRRASKRRRSARSSAVNIYQVARQAKVSIVTVSRVFNDYPHVSRAMREHVLEAARQVGYQPRLVTKRNLIGVLVGKLEDLAAGEQTSRLVLALMRAAASRGYLLEFFPATSAERATQHLADGLIALGLSSVELAGLRSLPSVPRVALNNLSVDESWSAVSVDPADEVQMAVRHLAEQGHTKHHAGPQQLQDLAGTATGGGLPRRPPCVRTGRAPHRAVPLSTSNRRTGPQNHGHPLHRLRVPLPSRRPAGAGRHAKRAGHPRAGRSLADHARK